MESTLYSYYLGRAFGIDKTQPHSQFNFEQVMVISNMHVG